MTTEQGEWRDVSGADLRVGDRVRLLGAYRPPWPWSADFTISGTVGTDIVTTDFGGGCDRDRTRHGQRWQRWTPSAPPVPDCRGHVGESFVGHVRPGQTVQFGSSCAVGGTHEPCMLLMTVGGTIDRAWTADDTHANPIATVCPSCAKPAQEHAAPIPASEHQTFNVQRALATREDVQDVVRSAIDHGSARGSTTHRVVIDPLASLRAEAARMLAEGHDERDVLGCFDLAMQCVRRGESIAHYTVEMFREQAAMMTLLRASELIVQANELHSARRCYHGRPAIPGACGWCAIVATRSDAS